MKMKKITAMALACVMALGLAACGGTSSSTGTSADSAAPASSTGTAAEPCDLVVAWWGSQGRNEKFQSALDLYAEQNPGVTIESQTNGFSDHLTALSAAAASNDMPDMAMLQGAYYQQYVDGDLLVDLTPYVESGALDLSNVSEEILAATTIDGKLYGIGMDGIGMAMAIEQAFGPVQGKRVLVIGAGAVGGLIPAELCKRGAASVAIANRTPEKANYIAKTLQGHFDVPTSYGSLDDTFLREQAAQADVLVQCSSVGNYAHPELKFESLDFIDALKDGCVVADVNYPSTQLLERAAARGLKTLSGESMMYYQQLAVIKLRFGIELPLASMQNAREAVATAVAMRPYYDYDEVAAQL